MSRFFVATMSPLLSSAYAPAQATGTRDGVHVETSFDVVVHAPVADALKLFTPEGERAWAGEHWDPEYIHPAGPTRDALGAVFTIQHGPLRAVWIVLRRDEVAREFAYAYFVPDLMVTTICVRFESTNLQTTSVHVAYARTALSQVGEAHVAAMAEGDKKAGTEWQNAIDKYLAGKTAPAR